ncbi:hypothetical protein 10S11_2 [uncultured Caudovirales phage]|uniref:DUF3102 domain-containing protein n=1 Tax=uncultured Caudovirales phage TaxID=2100421 RepID=A0A2H4J025_9CAUD|nr:hypothetical protein 10S11_2 [uncultured Caudovirales phage]
MNEIQNIDTLTTEILILKQQTAQNIIEIGKRLIAVKESLPHGKWGKWLEEKVDFTDRTAQRFMKVASEFSNTTALSDLPKSKVFALLDLPQEERDEFIENNPINEMSTRELQKAIKEKQELEKKLKAVEKKAEEEQKVREDISQNYDKLEKTNKKHYEKSEKLKRELEKIKNQLKKAKEKGNDEEIERIQNLLNGTETKLIDANKKIEELEELLKNKPVDITETIIEKVPEEIEKELQELREKIKQQPKDNEVTLKFKIHFENTVASIKNLLTTLAEIKEINKVEYEKYNNAVSGLMNKMLEKL